MKLRIVSKCVNNQKKIAELHEEIWGSFKIKLNILDII